MARGDEQVGLAGAGGPETYGAVSTLGIMFATGRHDVRRWLLEWAREDNRIVGAAITGSAARDAEDRWSDVDLFLGVADGVPVTAALDDWSALVYRELDALHHFDLQSGPATYRAFLLEELLEVDLGFTPAGEFGPLGDGAFSVVFGDPVQRRPARSTRDT